MKATLFSVDVPIILRQRVRVVCVACNWRGYRLDPTALNCPRCSGPVIPVANKNTPGTCCNCDHWTRDRLTPCLTGRCNRQGKYHPLTGQKTHEFFCCAYHQKGSTAQTLLLPFWYYVTGGEADQRLPQSVAVENDSYKIRAD